MNQRDLRKLSPGSVVLEKRTGWPYEYKYAVHIGNMDVSGKQIGNTRIGAMCVYIGTKRIPNWAVSRYFEARDIEIEKENMK